MSNRFKKIIIDDVISTNFAPGLQDDLLDLFESALKSIVCTLAREAVFDTSDFATAARRGCTGYTLRIIRVTFESGVSWHGVFTKESQRMEVIAHLE
ncbi:hypothetical protein [Candidatus Nitrotoga fabula]|uniref:Uncharacterized protein n=1 Tax=Candidatus Nitrotoga fabula TaxID=2182327 RepID=A0A916BCA9_9PROT|nr:hypothetical protein [Candidatus Nitrotoga fabula]CAE6686642.1 conserved hypothetical protein [Candidatus Nitrotoga fabula]